MPESAAMAADIAAACRELRRGEPEQSSAAVEELCRLATSPDHSVAQAGSDAIFRLIVEPLADSFEPRDCDRYIGFFSRVVEYCRRLPGGRPLDEKLRSFGLRTEAEFLTRAGRARRVCALPHGALQRTRKVLVLSRVTLGADVAVTSVILSRMKQLLPEADICLLGSPKASGLLASDGRVRLVPIEYRRDATLLDRLNAWPALAETVAGEIQGLAAGEYLLVDPDSRLTQLGLLPVTAGESRYLFFESRSYSRASNECLAALTGCWLDDVFGKAANPAYPYLSLSEGDRRRAESVRQALPGKIVAANLGVGDNARKRLADPFEEELLLALLEAGYKVLLDRGAGGEEIARTGALCEALDRRGRKVLALNSDAAAIPSADVITWEGSLSRFAGLIGVSDLYVGYDSAGGHLAGALGVPVIDIFAGAASARMRRRWSPWGRSPAHVIEAGPEADPRDILRQVRERLA